MYSLSRERRALRRRLVQSLTRFLVTKPAPSEPCIEDPKRIAIVRSNHRLGNVLMLTPLVLEVQRLWPSARIDIIAGGRLPAVFQQFPAINQCLPMPRPPGRALLNRTFRRAISQPYDLVINADPFSQSGRLLTRMIPAKCRLVGSSQPPGPLSEISPHMALRPIDMLRAATGGRSRDEYPRMTLNLTHSERERGARELTKVLQGVGLGGPVVGLYPFGDKRRNYPLVWWQQFLDQLRVYIPGVRLVEILPVHGQILLDTVNCQLKGQDLRHLCAQMGAMDLVLATDSGMMHLAACSGVTTFGLFRATDPAVYSPYGGSNRAWTQASADVETLARAARALLLPGPKLGEMPVRSAACVHPPSSGPMYEPG